MLPGLLLGIDGGDDGAQGILVVVALVDVVVAHVQERLFLGYALFTEQLHEHGEVGLFLLALLYVFRCDVCLFGSLSVHLFVDGVEGEVVVFY